jgi:hypothetical protein
MMIFDDSSGLLYGPTIRSTSNGRRTFMARFKASPPRNPARARRVAAIAGLFYILIIIGDGIIASWYASDHDMPWVAVGVGLLALVPLVLLIRTLKHQLAPERDGQEHS